MSAPVLAQSDTAARKDEALRVLESAARLLLQYNTRAGLIVRQIDRLAKHLGVDVLTVVGYRDVTLVLSDGRHLHAQVSELRINVAISLETRRVLDALCADRIGPDEACRQLESVERTASRHARWTLVALFGLAAAALSQLLQADAGAAAAIGVSSALGLVARQQLAPLRPAHLLPPFVAAAIGAVIGGAAIRFGWTTSGELCLVVPALMLVPGPHLINGVDDLLENHIPTALARLGLATGILMAAAFGVVFGGWLVGSLSLASASESPEPWLTLPADMALAGIAACGFGAFYNAPWRVLWISIVCGMAGHGVRFLAMEQGAGVGMATLMACLTIGVMAGSAAERVRAPFAAIAFAAAVPMMPGVFMYESIAGALRMAAAGASTDSTLADTTLGLAFKATFVVAAMAIGLLLGHRLPGVGRRLLSRT